MKPITPYNRLLADIKEFCFKFKHRPLIRMWYYPKDKLGGHWTLVDLHERTAAAEQLGFDVILSAREDGLYVMYQKKIKVPYRWEN